MLIKAKKSSYQIKKTMKYLNGRPVHVLMLDGNSEVYESNDIKEVNRMCEILNSNTDSGWIYSVIEVKNLR